jgi:hypothetical protein
MEIELNKFADSIKAEKSWFTKNFNSFFHNNFFDIRKNWKEKYKQHANIDKGIILFFNGKVGTLYNGDFNNPTQELALEEMEFKKYVFKHFGELKDFLNSKGLNIDDFPITPYGLK